VEIRWLEAFVAVAEELHFGRAAARLRLAQSPLSQTIRKLERELGVTLFDRSTRSVALTPAGRALLPHANRIFEELELARQGTRAVSGAVYGTINIGFSGALNLNTLPPLTRAVRRRYPQVTLNLVAGVLTRDGVIALEVEKSAIVHGRAPASAQVSRPCRSTRIPPRGRRAAGQQVRYIDQILSNAPRIILHGLDLHRDQVLRARHADDAAGRAVDRAHPGNRRSSAA